MNPSVQKLRLAGTYIEYSIVYVEDEEMGETGDDEDDDEPINPLVDALFDEVENLRLQVRLSFLPSFSTEMGGNPHHPSPMSLMHSSTAIRI